MATKKSFLEMHEAVGGSYSSPERVQLEQERNQKRQEKTAEINRRAVTQPKRATQEAVTSTGNQKKSTGSGETKITAPTTGSVQEINALLFSAADRKQAIKKGQDPIFAYINSEVGRAKDEATKQIPAIEQMIKELQGKKKPVGMDRTNVPYNKEIDSQITALQGQIDSARQQAADMNNILISAMPEEDRKALENYVNQRRTDWYDTLLQCTFGNGVIGTPGMRAEQQAAALAEKYGWDTVKSLAETLERQQNAEATARAQQEGAELGQEHPVLGSAASIPLNVVSGAPAVFERIRGLGTSTGQYPTLDPNNVGNLLGIMGSSIQGQVASDIEGEDPNLLRKAGSYAYRGGMSALESGLRAATGKAGTVLLSGLGSFEQNVAKASAQGASPEKAVVMGLTNAAIEALSEEIPLDNLLDAAKGGKQTLTQALKLALAQAGIEATTEEVSLVGSTLAEAAILKDKSEFNQYIQSRIAEGVDPQTARDEALRNLLDEAIDTAIVSAVSGGGMSGVNSLITNYEAKKQSSPQSRQEGAQAPDTPLQGEAADPRHLAQQQEQAREAAQAMEQEQQAQAAQQEAPQAPPATDPMLEGIQTPVAPAQEQPQQAALGSMLDGIDIPQDVAPEQTGPNPVADMLNPIQNPQQSAVDTPSPQNYNGNAITIPGAAVGSSGVTYTADNKPLSFQYAVVPAESLITSNDQFGNVNSAYPAELQPRDRTRAASQSQINNISRNLNPALLAESPTAQNGAPIIRGDGVVIGGNGRASAITQAYGAGRGADYQQFITQKAAELGIDPATIPANPVLVRVTNGVNNYTELANSLNAATTASYSATETAKIDASRIGDIIAHLSISENGGVNTAENREFIREFVSRVVPESERGDVMQANGQLSQAGERRIQNALFAYAYGDTALVERLAESTDNNAKNITNAMLSAAGKVAQLQAEIGRGEVQDLGLQQAITAAANLYLDAKAGKHTVEDAAGQLVLGGNGPEPQYDGLTVNLAKFMESNSRSGLQIRTFIDILADVNMNMPAESASQFSLFGTSGPQTQEVLYNEAIAAYDQQRDGKGRIPEKSDFSQYRQYRPGELATGMDGSRPEGNPGPAAPDGGIPQAVQGTVPGGQRGVTDPNSPGIKGTGAAERDFSGKAGYYEFLSDENSQPDRSGDVRPMEVLRTDPYGRRVSDFAANAYAAPVTSDPMADRIQSLIQDGALGFDRQNSEEALRSAGKYIKDKGKGRTKNEIIKDVSRGIVKDGDIEKAMLLYAEYANGRGETSLEDASEMMVALSMMAHQSGRNLNLFKLLRRMTPEGQLMTVQKTVQNQIDSLNRKRSKKHQIQDVQIPQELQQQYLDLARRSMHNEEMVSNYASEQLSEIVGNQRESSADRATRDAFQQYESLKNPPQRNDLAENVGRRVADTLSRTAEEHNQSVEDVLYREIMSFANDKARYGAESSAVNEPRNLNAIRDYYRYRPFFQTAWDVARSRVEQTMQTMVESDPRLPVLENFLASGDSVLGLENESPVDTVDYANPKSTLRKGVKEAAGMVGVKMENRAERQQKTRQAVRDILVENADNKAMAAKQIVQTIMQGMDLSESAADAMAQDIVRAFYNDLADQSARRLASMFGERASSKKVEKTMSQKLTELFNMGAFSSDQYRTAAFDSIFGEDSGVEIPDSLLEKLANANAGQKAEVEQAIYAAAASQIKATPLEKWNTWRYMAMMANVKTNARNLAGNAMYMPYTEAKRIVGTIIERAVLKQDQRTKALLNPASQSDKALLSWAKADSSSGQAADALKYSAKLGDDVSAQKIDEQRRIFDSDILEKVRKVSEYLPAQGDMLFKNHEYAVSLAGFLKARGYTVADIESGKVSASVMTEARTYAINEAMRATFNDSNAFSDLVATAFRYNGNNPIGIAANALGEGIMPFRRTPANVLVRAFENSPLGLIKTANDIRHNLTDGSASAATIIDDVAANLTGTAAMGLGYLLASGFAGIKLRGSYVDDDEKRRGHMEYAIEFSIGGQEYSYTIDWAAPANLPLFVGANLYSALEGSGKDASYSTFTAIVRALGLSFEPMLALSCMSSLNDLIEAGKYSDGNALYSLAAQAATSYLTQGIPSLARQTYQATQKNKQSTFANSEDPLLRGIQRKAAAVPFLGAAFQTDRVDEWGQTESTGSIPKRIFNAYFNPGTIKAIDNSPLEREITRLNAAQPDSVSPPSTAKTITYTDSDGEKHKDQRLTEEQYSTLATVQGQTARNILDEALDSSIYQSMTDEQKAKVFDYTYAYARELGRTEAIDGYQGMDAWMEAAEKNPTKAILDRVVKSGFDDAFDSLTHAWEYDKDPASAVSSLENAYSVYSGMSKEEQEKFKENTGGKVGYFLDAKDAGIDGETFTELYKTYSDIDAQDSDASAKARNWAYYLNKEKAAGHITASQEETLKDSMAYYVIFPADAGKFNGLTEAGLSADSAQKVVGLLDGITGTGKDGTVRNIDKYKAIAGSSLSAKDKETAFLEYAPDSMDEKYNYAKKNMTKNGKDITIDDFVKAYQVTDEYSKKKEQTDAWQAMGYTAAEANNLYKLYDGKLT